MDDQEEKDLIARIRRGERAAFTILVDTYGKAIYNLALRMTGRPEDAEDLAQEIFFRAFNKLDRFDPNRRFYTWLYTIALNLIRTHLRKNRSHRQMDSLDMLHPSDKFQDMPDGNGACPARADGLDRQLQALPEELRELLVLRFYQDIPFDVIAEMTGLSQSAVKMRVYRGLEKLKILLLNSEG